MKKTLLTIGIIFFNLACFSQVTNTNPLTTLGAYNFGGGNTGFSDPSAQVSYGFQYKFKDSYDGFFEFRPTMTTPVNATLSKNYLPALMLPGNASININTYLPLGKYFIWNPVNVGLKFLGGFSDSSKTIVQHNIRTAFALEIPQFILLTAEYTWAWHNSTDDSQNSFGYAFNKYDINSVKTGIQYLTLTLQGRISAAGAVAPSYLVVQWRRLSNPGQFTTLPNNRFFSIGLAAALDPLIGSHTANELKSHAVANKKRVTQIL